MYQIVEILIAPKESEQSLLDLIRPNRRSSQIREVQIQSKTSFCQPNISSCRRVIRWVSSSDANRYRTLWIIRNIEIVGGKGKIRKGCCMGGGMML